VFFQVELRGYVASRASLRWARSLSDQGL